MFYIYLFSSNRLRKAIKEGKYDIEAEPWPQISSSAKDLIK